MLIALSILLISLGIIIYSCEVFTNAVEWLGKKLKVGEGVVGSIFAAVGTALPETVVPIMAILFGGKEGIDVGIGAIAGAPFMLSTLAFFITGLAVVLYTFSKKRRIEMEVNSEIISRDIGFFIVVYSIAVLTTFVDLMVFRAGVVIFLIGSYMYYIYKTVKRDNFNESGLKLEELFFTRWFKLKPKRRVILGQLFLALGGIIIGAHFFVDGLKETAHILHVPSLVLSLILTPIATELPEKFNSIIWIGKGKDTLALGNITGAMVFQSCIPVAVGILFTPWHLDKITLFSALMAILSGFMNYVALKLNNRMSAKILILSGVFYLGFIIYTFLTMKLV